MGRPPPTRPPPTRPPPTRPPPPPPTRAQITEAPLLRAGAGQEREPKRSPDTGAEQNSPNSVSAHQTVNSQFSQFPNFQSHLHSESPRQSGRKENKSVRPNKNKTNKKEEFRNQSPGQSRNQGQEQGFRKQNNQHNLRQEREKRASATIRILGRKTRDRILAEKSIGKEVASV